MKIHKMHLKDFRCFSDCVLDFEDHLTVFVAENAAGKTAILDALAYGFARYFRGFPRVKTPALKDTDVRLLTDETQANACMIAWSVEAEGKIIRWGSMRRGPKGDVAKVRKDMETFSETVVDKNDQFPEKEELSISEYTSRLMQLYRDNEPFELPVVVYYGTDRVVRSEIQRRRNFKKVFTRFDALQGALEGEAYFKQAFEWFNAIEDEERRERDRRGDRGYRDARVDAVRNAVSEFLPAVHNNLRTETRPLRLVVDRTIGDGQTKTLRIGQLSDGVRVILGLVMDLVRRLLEANPDSNPKEVFSLPAIVLIDEVDLHLHPRWQQKIITDLTRVFTNTQFIVTTHSPQVLSSVPPESLRVIRYIEKSGDGGELIIEDDYSFLKGAESQYILENIFSVSSRPPHITETVKLDRYKELVDADRWDDDEAIELRKWLNNWGGGYEADLHRLDLAIRVKRHQRKR